MSQTAAGSSSASVRLFRGTDRVNPRFGFKTYWSTDADHSSDFSDHMSDLRTGSALYVADVCPLNPLDLRDDLVGTLHAVIGVDLSAAQPIASPKISACGGWPGVWGQFVLQA